MLTTPTSPVVRHRVGWRRNSPAPAEAGRLAQVRTGTLDLYPPDEPVGEPPPAASCSSCDGFGFSSPATLAFAEDVMRHRPSAVTAIDQCHLDAASLLRRLAAVSALRPVSCSRVAFVGDDDLASIALLRSGPPARLLLVDIDERILNVVGAEAKRLGVTDRVVLEQLDLSAAADVSRLMDRHGESFDLVVTDPPYAEGGMRTFVGTGLRLAAYGGEIHIAVPALIAESWTDELLLTVQSELLACGFVIERVHPGAFTYLTSDVVSSLVVARRIPGSRLAAGPIVSGLDRFYTRRTPPGALDAGAGSLTAHEKEWPTCRSARSCS
ncbi:MAG: bis-aminopropyl spermidine synthase family protein [Egibacteraceae bacterium]